MNNRRKLIAALGAGTLIAPLSSFAQQPAKVHRIGFLRTSAPPDAYLEAFRQGLKDLGYIDGKNIAFEYRWAGGNDQLPALAAELARLKLDVLVTEGTPPAQAAKKAMGTIPIVMVASGDPVGTGLVASLARPGGNITGLTSINADLGGKELELLKEIVPRLTHVAILGAEKSPVHKLFLKNTEAPARALGLKLIPLLFGGPGDYDNIFRTAIKERVQAIVVRGVPVTSAADRQRLVDLAAKNRLPAIYETEDMADFGGLISYGASRIDMYRRCAVFVEKILKGANPANLPVEQPTKFELIINMKTARALGIKIPNSILVRATRMIE
jgi:putative ABC transport system substrate-binding protein